MKESNGTKCIIFLTNQNEIPSQYIQTLIDDIVLDCIENNIDLLFFTTNTPIISKKASKYMFQHSIKKDYIMYCIITSIKAIKNNNNKSFDIQTFNSYYYNDFLETNKDILSNKISSIYLFYNDAFSLNLNDNHIETIPYLKDKIEFFIVSTRKDTYYKIKKIQDLTQMNEDIYTYIPELYKRENIKNDK